MIIWIFAESTDALNSMLTLLGTWGPSGAAIAVTYMFLQYMKGQNEDLHELADTARRTVDLLSRIAEKLDRMESHSSNRRPRDGA